MLGSAGSVLFYSYHLSHDFASCTTMSLCQLYLDTLDSGPVPVGH